MYDSRSKHPRNGRHSKREEAHEYGYFTPAGQRGLTKEQDVAEQIAAIVDLDAPAVRPRVGGGLSGFNFTPRAHKDDAVLLSMAELAARKANRERHTDSDAHLRVCADCAHDHAIMNWEYYTEQQEIAAEEYLDDELEALERADGWMPRMSQEELEAHMGGGWHNGGWHIVRAQW